MKLPLDERTAICSSKDNSFDHFVMKGKVLQDYEQYAENLVQFLYKSYQVRIDLIAIDFMKDEHDVIYFVDVNGFKVAEYEKFTKLKLLSDD